jgi:acyl-CoA synthetase (AMP-forming)/AMP-acid ligase II
VAGTAEIKLETITVQLRPQLARFKLPRTLLITESLPFTASGKLDRRTCANRFGPLC